MFCYCTYQYRNRVWIDRYLWKFLVNIRSEMEDEKEERDIRTKQREERVVGKREKKKER